MSADKKKVVKVSSANESEMLLSSDSVILMALKQLDLSLRVDGERIEEYYTSIEDRDPKLASLLRDARDAEIVNRRRVIEYITSKPSMKYAAAN